MPSKGRGDMLKPIDLQTYLALRHLIEKGKSAPSVQDLALALGVTTTPAYHRLRRLRSLGLVDWQPRIHRTIRLIEK